MFHSTFLNALLVFCGALLAWVGSILFWNNAFNSVHKKKLFREYAEHGTVATATVTRQNGGQWTQSITFVYQTERLTCHKRLTRTRELLPYPDAPLPFPLMFPVRILPNLPRSGVPEIWVKDSESRYNSFARYVRAMLLSALILDLGIACVVAGLSFPNQNALDLFLTVTLSLIVSLISGLAVSVVKYYRWKANLLEADAPEQIGVVEDDEDLDALVTSEAAAAEEKEKCEDLLTALI